LTVAYVCDQGEEFDDGDELDLSELACPRCGANDLEILTLPRGDVPRKTSAGWSGSWFGGSGKARCNFCGASFAIHLDTDPGEGEE
jgi:DNA-directed RNA polymerase subunit RPC12/RpoP